MPRATRKSLPVVAAHERFERARIAPLGLGDQQQVREIAERFANAQLAATTGRRCDI